MSIKFEVSSIAQSEWDSVSDNDQESLIFTDQKEQTSAMVGRDQDLSTETRSDNRPRGYHHLYGKQLDIAEKEQNFSDSCPEKN